MKQNKEYYEDLVNDVKADFARRRQQKFALERKWELNMNFVAGNQYNDIYPDGEIREIDKDYFWQSRRVYNHIAPILEARIKFAMPS